jgi:THO complex subunit 5
MQLDIGLSVPGAPPFATASPPWGACPAAMAATAPASFAELDRVKELCEQIRATSKAAAGGAAGTAAAELVLMDIKGASRGVHLRIEATKKLSDTEKANFDSNSLQLHNLLYEKHHYQREIARCQDFRSRSEDVELVDVGSFQSAAPPELRRAGEPPEPHQLMVDRLEFELLERQRLAQEESVLAARKSELAATVRAKVAFLGELPAHLQAMRTGSAALEQAFAAPISVQQQQHSAARSLPAALYVVFAQLEAYRDTADAAVTVAIRGHVADAEAWYKVRNEVARGDGRGAAEAGDVEEEEEGRRSKRAKVEKSSDSSGAAGAADADGAAGDDDARGDNDDEEDEDEEQEEDGGTGAAATPPDVFPLVVTALVPIGDAGSIRILFSYAPSIVSVLADAELVSTGGITDGELCGARLLSTLYPDDCGLSVPEQSNGSAGWDPCHRARPYRWAQFIAGLPAAGGAGDSASDIDQRAAWQAVSADGGGRARTVRSVFGRVVDRAAAQAALRDQLRALAEHELQPSADLLLVPRGQDMVKLTRWELAAVAAAGGDKSAAAPDISGFLASWECDPGAMCQKGQLVAAVDVPADYPLRAPTFRLKFTKCPGIKAGETTDEDAAGAANDSVNVLRQIEAEVNSCYSPPQADDSGRLLTSQVGRLMCCLAVHAATLSAAATGMPTLFCSRPHRGRGRSHPLKHDTQQQQFA